MQSQRCTDGHDRQYSEDAAARIAALEKDRQRLADELAAAQKQNAALSSRVSDLERQLAAAKQRNADLEAQLAAMGGMAGDKNKLAAELAAARQRIADLEKQLADCEARVADLRSQLDQSKGSLAKAEKDLIKALQPEISRGLCRSSNPAMRSRSIWPPACCLIQGKTS